MKRHWLQGLLLGVSLVLFLAGGVALAQGLVMTVDQDCVECYPVEGGPNHALPPDEYRVDIMVTGWDHDETACVRLHLNGEPFTPLRCGIIPAEEDPIETFFAFPCEAVLANVQGLAEEIVTPEQYTIEDLYGEWKYRFWQPATGEAASVTWRFAEVCEEEFVPEPGSMILLGSGLAGLAGYASLRWRSRK
jgi:hypothetical protein